MRLAGCVVALEAKLKHRTQKENQSKRERGDRLRRIRNILSPQKRINGAEYILNENCHKVLERACVMGFRMKGLTRKNL